ncbi:MAG: hypothetical protein JWP01_3755 [Myxococcales bacterium]|nr:hypothetical protein [Myxococcales bacterium]
MKNLKVVILICGILGLVSMFLPMGSGMPSMFSIFMEFDKFQLILMLAAFGVPTAVAAMGLAKPPAQAWHGIAALAGFALAAVKTRIWSSIGHIMDAPMSGKLMLIATIVGLVVAIMAVVKPEAKA